MALVLLFAVTVPAHAGGLVSTGMEIDLGRSVRDEVLDEYELWEDPADNKLVAELGDILVPMIEEREIEYEFYIIEHEEANAFALPGGIIFINTGLLDFCERDEYMIAGVLAHEISHVARRHHRDSIEDALIGSFGLGILFHILDLDEDWMQIAGVAIWTLIRQGNSRENEYDADAWAVRLMYESGWNPELGIIMFLRETEKEFGDNNELGDFGECIASHPETDRRMYFAELELEELRGSMGFEEKPIPLLDE
jgi:predicted Zn-dependent protease